MRKIVLIAVFGVSLGMVSCTEKKVEPVNKTEVKSPEIKLHGGGSVTDSDYVGFKDVIKNQVLPAYPSMTVGKAFDGYSYFVKKEWKETRGANGTMYIDLTGWFQKKSLGIDAIKKGVFQQGIEVKFVINRDSVFFVGMVSKLEAKTDGNVYAYPLPDVKAVLDDIYANREISF